MKVGAFGVFSVGPVHYSRTHKYGKMQILS